MGLKKIFKKVGNVAKKALPFAGLAASFIPGVGQAVGGLLGSAGKFLGLGGSVPPAQGAISTPGAGGTEVMPPTTVTPPFDWMKALQTAAPFAGAAAQWYGQRQTNAANAQQAQQQMDFQERLSNTGYQRATQDMRASGLNPMLAYSQGPASSPGGAQAQIQSETGSAVSTAFQGAQAMAQLEQLTASTDNTRAVTNLTKAQALTELERVHQIAQDTRTSSAQEAHYRKAIDQMISNIVGQGIDQDARRRDVPRQQAMEGFYKSPWGREVAPYLSSARDAVGIGVEGLSEVMKARRPINIFKGK